MRPGASCAAAGRLPSTKGGSTSKVTAQARARKSMAFNTSGILSMAAIIGRITHRRQSIEARPLLAVGLALIGVAVAGCDTIRGAGDDIGSIEDFGGGGGTHAGTGG